MIVDLNLSGKNVLVVGAGHEAERKVEALLSQGCNIIVVAETSSERIHQLWVAGKIRVKEVAVSGGGFLDYFDKLALVMAVTNDREVNRKIVDAARKRSIPAYAADDPDISDFSHPAVINLYDTVQIAISTGGRSPLMAKIIREKAETIFRKIIQRGHVLQIRLQELLRKEAQASLPTPERRKQFLEAVLNDEAIKKLLDEERIEDAAQLALKQLREQASPKI
jgi:precorrin-2 dehydrogenase/sirohydrochlorin ferrochelatase